MTEVYDYKQIYRKMFADPTYSVHDIAEPHFQVVIDVIDEISRKGAPSVVDIGSGRGWLLELLDLKYTYTQNLSVDLQKFHKCRVPFISADISTMAGLKIIRSIQCDLLACLNVLEHLTEYEIEWAVCVFAKIAPVAVIQPANHEEIINGIELHRTRKPKEWWRDLLARHYNIVKEETFYDNRLYSFVCKAKQ